MAGTLASLNVRIGANIEGLQKGLKSVKRQLSRTSRELQNVGSDFAQALSLPIIGLGAAGIREAAKLESLTKGLESIMGSSEAAAREIELLRAEAQKPGLAFEQAVRGSLRLQAIGLSAQQSRETLSAFGNALALVGGTAEDLNGVALALSQIAAKGKVSAEEINQIAERVPQIRQVLNDSFGTSEGQEISKILDQAGLDVKDFIGIVTTELDKLPEAQDTLSNSFTNLRQGVSEALASIGQDINETFNVQDIIKAFTDRLRELTGWFRGLSDESKRSILTFAAIAAAIGPVLFAVGKLIAVFRSVTSVLALIASPTTLIIGLIGALAAAAVYASENWKAFSVAFSNAWKTAYNFVVDIIEKILTSYSGFLKKISFGKVDIDIADAVGLSRYETEVVPKFKSFGQSMKDFASGAVKSLGFVSESTKKTSNDTQTAVSDATKTYEGLADAISDVTKESEKLAKRGENGLTKEEEEALRKKRKKELQGYQGLLGNLRGSIGQFTTPDINTSDLSVGFDGVTASQKNLERISVKTKAALGAQIEVMNGVDLAAKRMEEALYKVGDSLLPISKNMADVAAAGGTFSEVAAEIKKSAASIIGSMIRQGVASVVSGALTKSSFLGPLAIPIGLAAGALAQGAFNSILGSIKIPAFANGNIAFGPTLGIFGEYSNAWKNPEVTAPLDKLKGYMGGNNIEVHVTGRIAGKDIQLANERNQQSSNRLRGY